MHTPMRDELHKHYAINPETLCWIWLRAKDRYGYGHITVGGKTTTTHRFSWEHHYEPVPAGMNVLHKCDNRLCLNPKHLYTGTTKQNAEDRLARNPESFPKGTKHPSAKLTATQVSEARSQYIPRSKTHSGSALAKKYGISKSNMSKLIHGHSYVE